MKDMGRPHNPNCTLCGSPKIDKQWCARCWRIYQRARRRGLDTRGVLRTLRAEFAAARAAATHRQAA